MEFSLETLGRVIREHREAKKPPMTQDDLGDKAGYKSGAGVSISRIESGLTRPSPERFEGIARALGLSTRQLEAEAAKRTLEVAKEQGEPRSGGAAKAAGDERIKDRIKRIQHEIERRTTLITELGDKFNEAHDRARDDFFMKFIEIADGINGVLPPDRKGLQVDDADDAQAEAQYRQRFTSYGVAHVLAGGAGGAFAGAAVGGAAAYGTFMAAVSFGSASTGAAIAGLSGVTATNAALALLGGGTLAAGGAGVAGGTALLASIVAAPALLLTVGGLVWMVRRNRKQQQELTVKLDAADEEIAATRRGFEAFANILPRATKTLDYIAVHGGHSLKRWEGQLGPRPRQWNSMSPDEQQRYKDFIALAASQLSVVTINVQELMASRGEDREKLIEFADEVLKQAQSTIESLV
ncbi:helix-turn-helix transcriptional regulator [Mycobacterium sp. RTGN5]|uniref:helix-turn-helix domain-containing protein n=1 Tax=Mycobacterium sp. RTGN5 TaxID=3016522 RepID=UPI0029C832C1|nr:helix-turn-helix transcriptional regulator [Mycobacterium sp. RTGN5]